MISEERQNKNGENLQECVNKRNSRWAAGILVGRRPRTHGEWLCCTSASARILRLVARRCYAYRWAGSYGFALRLASEICLNGGFLLHWHDRSTLARSIYTGTIDLHWHDRSTLARSIYTGTFDLHWRDRTALARSKWFNGWPPRESSAPNPSLRRRCYYILGRVTPNRLQDAVIAAEKKST